MRPAAHRRTRKTTRKAGRSAPIGPDFADGRVLSGSEALKHGFVDELGDFDKAVERAKKIASIGNANLIEYRERYDISDFFSLFGESEFHARHQARSRRGDAKIAGGLSLFSLADICKLK